MFAYSLSGLQIEGDAQGVTEVEENEITARSAVYQVLGQLFGVLDADHYDKARNGQWVKELTEAAELLAFDWEIGDPPVDESLDSAAYTEEHRRLFLADSERPSLQAGTYLSDREQALGELARAYEYYGLGSSDDGVPLDHLTAELDFMQLVTFKEAAASSPRLGKSFRRAQLDFLDRQLAPWVSTFAAAVAAESPLPFFGWAVERLATWLARLDDPED